MTDRSSPEKRYFLLSLAWAVLFLAPGIVAMNGCRAVNPLQGFGLEKPSREEERITRLMKWRSGRVEVYRDFRTLFNARAVLITDEIRRAVVDWDARSRLLDPEEKRDLYNNTFKGGTDDIQVLLGFYTPDEERNSIGEKDSAWVPFLVRPDGTAVRATCFEEVDDERKTYMDFLKWDLSWAKLYMVCFPGPPEGSTLDEGGVKLVITGPKGRGEMLLRTSPPPP